MATRVNVTSVEAIESFRASLIVYLSKARPTLDEVAAEVARVRTWVQYTQRSHYDGIARQQVRMLEEATAALFSAKMSNLREVSSAEQMMVTRAKRAREQTEIKLRVLKKWDRDFDSQTEPIGRQLEKLQSLLSDDLVKAVAYLTQALTTLQAYAGIIAPSLEGVGEAKTGEGDAASMDTNISTDKEGGQS